MKPTRPGRRGGALALSLSLCACASSGQALRPFSSDGCSLFSDGNGERPELWQACCVRHDLAYWRGGSAAERQQADAALCDCVFEQSGDRLLARQMYRGVRLGGTPALPTGFRWAYGWHYGAPAYALAAYVAHERVDAHHHHTGDVIAAAALSYGVGRLFVTPGPASYLAPVVGPDFLGMRWERSF